MYKLAVFTIAMLLAASAASAQGVCQGPSPTIGTVIHGPVLEVPNGSSLCVATGASPETWIRVNVARSGADRSRLMAAAFGKNATCAIGRDGEADCSVEGQSLASTLHQPEVIKAAMEWR